MTLLIPSAAAGGGVSNGTVISGVAHFVTDTKPTTRIDGSALVSGDRWYKLDDGTEWFWNGTYWLSPAINWQGYLTGTVDFGSSNMGLSGGLNQLRYQFMITSVFWASNIVTCDNSNYWEVVFGPRVRSNFTTVDNGNNLGFDNVLFEVKQSSYVPSQSATLNIVPTQNADTYITDSWIYLRKTGSPSTARIYLSLFFSSIFP